MVVEGWLERDRGRVWLGEGRRRGSCVYEGKGLSFCGGSFEGRATDWFRESRREGSFLYDLSSEMGRIELEGWVGFAKVVQRVVFSISRIVVVLSESYQEWFRKSRGYEWTGCFYV